MSILSVIKEFFMQRITSDASDQHWPFCALFTDLFLWSHVQDDLSKCSDGNKYIRKDPHINITQNHENLLGQVQNLLIILYFDDGDKEKNKCYFTC